MDRSSGQDVSAKTRTTNVEHENPPAPAEALSPRAVKGWTWALVVAALLSSLLFALDNPIRPVWFGAGCLLGAASAKLITSPTGLKNHFYHASLTCTSILSDLGL
jgi:hypothetical protein